MFTFWILPELTLLLPRLVDSVVFTINKRFSIMFDNKSDKLLLEMEEDDAAPEDQHPRCEHGPTVLFHRQSQLPDQGYYACSAHRDSKLCNYHLPADQWKGQTTRTALTKRDYPLPCRKPANPAICDPTLSLTALSQDKVNAQYFFDEAALNFLANQCEHIGARWVIPAI